MKKRFLFLMIGLNLLIISSISMSLAWFRGSTDLNIDKIDINLKVGEDLKISLVDDYKLAKDSLTAEDFEAAGKSITKFVPVSSMFSEHSGWVRNPKSTIPDFYANYKSATKPDAKTPGIAARPSITNKGYFQTKLYLFSDKHSFATFDSEEICVDVEDEYVTALNEKKAEEKAELKATNEYRAVAEKEMKLIGGVLSEAQIARIYADTKQDLYETYLKEIREDLKKIQDSVRISILDHQNLSKSFNAIDEKTDGIDTVGDYTIINPKKYDPDTKITKDPVVFGGRLSTSVTKDYYDHFKDRETGELRELLFGDVKYQNYDLEYLPEATSDVPVTGTSSCFNAGTRKGVRPLDMDKLENNITFYTEQSISPYEADITTHPGADTTSDFKGFCEQQSGYSVELFPGVGHPLTLTVYLEGWDRDNTDITMEASFKMHIKFRLWRQGGPL